MSVHPGVLSVESSRNEGSGQITVCEEDQLYLGQRFDSHVQAIESVRKYGYAALQLYVLSGNSKRAKPSSPLRSLFPYSIVRFICKHGGKYRPRNKEGPLRRPKQKTLKIGCPAFIKLKLMDGKLEIVSLCLDGHNHPVNRNTFSLYPEVRKLSGTEKLFAKEMLLIHNLRPKKVAEMINKKRLEAGVAAMCCVKDVHNQILSQIGKKPLSKPTGGRDLKAIAPDDRDLKAVAPVDNDLVKVPSGLNQVEQDFALEMLRKGIDVKAITLAINNKRQKFGNTVACKMTNLEKLKERHLSRGRQFCFQMLDKVS